MKISFFEEFPTKRNLDKVKLCKFDTNLYVKANSLKEFLKLEERINKDYKNVRDVIYWPTLTKDEGYWLSPFSKRKAMKKVLSELKNHPKQVKMLWDAELPLHNKMLYLSQLPFFLQNKVYLQRFFKKATQNKINIHTAEYGFENRLLDKAFQFLCLSFPAKYPHKAIFMMYTSFVPEAIKEGYLQNQMNEGKRKYGADFKAGLGTISLGILGNEPILSAESLREDLLAVQKAKIKEAVIFRLGGLNPVYAKVVNSF